MPVVARRLVETLAKTLLVLWMVTILSFMLMEAIPGDTIDLLVPPNASASDIAAIEQAYGLDRPLVSRYGDWLGGVVQGDFGRSVVSRQSTGELILERFPVSLELALYALMLALLIAVPAGIYCAYRPGSIGDQIVGFLSSTAIAVPTFLLGPILVYVFAIQTGWFPITGYRPWSAGAWEHLKFAILPVLTLGLGEAVILLRVLRSDMIATLREDFVVSARARGLSTVRILVVHALRPSSFAMITVLGVSLGRLIGGSVIVESIFRIPGLGQLMVTSINGRDIVTTQAAILVIGVTYVLLNGLVSASYAMLDPRVRNA